MPGRAPLQPLAAILATLWLALSVGLASTAAADAGSPSTRTRAEGAVASVLRGWRLAEPRSLCRPLRRATRGTYTCVFQGRQSVDRRADRFCHGRMRVRRAGRHWRKRVLARRCRTAPVAAPPQAAPKPDRAGAPSPPAGPGSRASQLFGYSDNTVQAGAASAGQVADRLQQGGSDVARVTFDWRWVEPFENDYRFGLYDTIYREYLARGVRPIFTILFSPWWTWDPAISCDQWTQDCTYPPARSHDGDWRKIAALLASRYPKAAGIEIWNEPNLHWFWRPRPDVGRYTELQTQAYAAIKSVSPSMPVVSAGLNNNTVTSGSDVSLTDFASGIYANGGKNSMDALNVHPYPYGLDQRGFTDSIAALRQVRDQSADAGKPLWVTELGLSTTGEDPGNVVTPDEQAQALVGYYRMLRKMPDVGLVTLHTLIEPRGWRMYDPLDREVGFGVLDRYLRPKPAFCALAAERGNPAPCTPGQP